MKKKALFIAIPLALGLTACGGGNDTTASSGTSLVSIMVTDAISTQYTKVWVTIKKITVTDANGTVVTLFDDPAGRVFNLTELRGVSNLLDLASLTPGTYTDLTIVMDPTVTLNDGTATPIQAQLDQATVTVPGSITIAAGQTSLGIDFDLANFNYDATTGIVTPSIVMRDHASMQRLAQAYAELEGTIKSVSSANTTDFVMTTRTGNDVRVSLLGNATVLMEQSASGQKQVVRDNTLLSAGQPVEVFGNYDPTALTIDAVRVRVGRAGSPQGQAFYGRDKVEGLATLSADTLTVDVREASFVPTGNQISFALGTTIFEKGTRDDLNNATRPLDVEVRGDWDATTETFTPVVISIEGAEPRSASSAFSTSGTSSASFPDKYVEVKGRLNQDYDSTADTMQIDVLSYEHVDSTIPSSLTVALDGAWFKHGNSGCLTKDAFVEVKGALDPLAAELAARVVEIESACSFSGQPVDDIEDDDQTMGGMGNSAMLRMSEVRGLIQSVDPTAQTLTLEIIRARGIGTAQVGDLVTIDYSGSPLFDRGTATDLAANRLIEVEGNNWQAASTTTSPTIGTLNAGRIDFI